MDFVAGKTVSPHKQVGAYLLDRLYQHGVRHIFGIPGDYVIRFNKQIEQHPIHFINATRENTAGYMADAYARLNGLGVACITYGVGINIVNALAQAYVEGSPLVVISGAAGEKEVSQKGALHHLIHQPAEGLDQTQLEIFRQVTVAQTVLDDPLQAAQKIEEVLQICIEAKRPVYIELPRDQVEAPLATTTIRPAPSRESDPEALQEALEEVLSLLQKSHRPLIWAGHEIRSHRLQQPLLQFAQLNHIPIVSTLLGKTVVDETHPLFVGVYQGEMSEASISHFAHQADACLFLGGVLTDVDTGMFTAKLVEEKTVRAQQRGVQIGHHEYPQVRFDDFVHGLAKLQRQPGYDYTVPSRKEAVTTQFTPQPNKKITSEALFHCLQSHITPEHFLVTDIGDCLFGATDLVLSQESFLACAYFATLGFGTPGAIGAQVALPQRRVIGLVGDGAFQMTAPELSTAARYGLDPIIIVMNNHGYGTERPLLEGDFNNIQNWQYSKLVDIFGGGKGYRVTTEEECNQALRESLSQRGQYVIIEVELDKLDFSPAMQRFCALVKKRI